MFAENNLEVKKFTSFKVGGAIEKVVFPANEQEFVLALEKYPHAPVLGNLTNTLISSDGYAGVVILTTKMTGFKIKDKRVIADCGVRGAKLSQAVKDKCLSGLEFMITFPGTVGGEVFMNAGAHGQSVADTFVKGQFYDREAGKIVTLNKEEMEFSYRTSVCQKRDLVVLSAEFELQEADVAKIDTKMKENLVFRHFHQPSLALPNCGSVFRNPEGLSAGKLLDEVGAKSFAVGGAKVWEKHANFIVNIDDATSSDILELMLKMQSTVQEKCGTTLIPEVRYLGNKNKSEEDLCKKLYQSLIKM